MYNVFISALGFIPVFTCEITCQSTDLVKSGVEKYKSGDYQAALNNFNSALQTGSSLDNSKPTTQQSGKVYTDQSDKTYVRETEKQTMTTSEKTYVRESEMQTMETSTKKYYAEPLEYQGDEPAKIYLYRGRTYLQLGNKEAALNDFDKAVSLDPTLSDALFRRAVENSNVDPSKACPDLLAAIERGHKSAKELYDLICK